MLRKVFVVEARNAGGRVEVPIQVCICTPPLKIHYVHDHLECRVGQESTNRIIETFGHLNLVNVTIRPELPKGLFIDTSSAGIFGIPEEPFPRTVFSMLAEARGGCTLESRLSIEVHSGTSHTCWTVDCPPAAASVLAASATKAASSEEDVSVSCAGSADSSSSPLSAKSGESSDPECKTRVPANAEANLGEGLSFDCAPSPVSVKVDPSLAGSFRFTTSIPTLSSTLNPGPVSISEIRDSDFESDQLELLEAQDDSDSSLKFLYRRQRNLVYATGAPIASNTVATQLPSSDIHFLVTPNLPVGLILDSKSGLISGIPQSVAEPRMYTITASTQDQQWKASLQMEVQMVPTPAEM